MSEKTNVFVDENAYENTTGVWSQLVGKEFIEWLITGAGKDVINNFTYNGEKLFFTN